jgi:hypothetical protein
VGEGDLDEAETLGDEVDPEWMCVLFKGRGGEVADIAIVGAECFELVCHCMRARDCVREKTERVIIGSGMGWSSGTYTWARCR